MHRFELRGILSQASSWTLELDGDYFNSNQKHFDGVLLWGREDHVDTNAFQVAVDGFCSWIYMIFAPIMPTGVLLYLGLCLKLPSGRSFSFLQGRLIESFYDGLRKGGFLAFSYRNGFLG